MAKTRRQSAAEQQENMDAVLNPVQGGEPPAEEENEDVSPQEPSLRGSQESGDKRNAEDADLPDQGTNKRREIIEPDEDSEDAEEEDDGAYHNDDDDAIEEGEEEEEQDAIDDEELARDAVPEDYEQETFPSEDEDEEEAPAAVEPVEEAPAAVEPVDENPVDGEQIANPADEEQAVDPAAEEQGNLVRDRQEPARVAPFPALQLQVVPPEGANSEWFMEQNTTSSTRLIDTVADDSFFLIRIEDETRIGVRADNQMTLSLRPYKVSRTGMGTQLQEPLPVHQVLEDADGSCLRFNEPTNRMGVLMAKKTINALQEARASFQPGRNGKKINNQGERKPWEDVYKEMQIKIQTDAAYEEVEDYRHTRRMDFMWGIQVGFNTAGNINLLLRQVAITYAEMRLGLRLVEKTTDLAAAMEAFKIQFIAYRPDHAEEGAGNGQSWLLGIHMLNDHLSLEGVQPVLVHPNGQVDERDFLPSRKDTTTGFWQGETQYFRESRDLVKEQLLCYLQRVVGRNFRALLPVCEGPPADALQAPIRAGRFRRSFNG